MATEGSNRFSFEKQDLDDTISCCICMNVFTDPKALPCIHTFCVKCLQQTALNTNKGPEDEIPCPICRRQFKIPQEGFSGLPNNFLIAKLIQVASVPNSSKSSNLCEVCLEAKGETTEEISKADMYCTDCNQKLCKECCKQHRKCKLKKNHKLIPINEQLVHVSDENTRVTLSPSVCELHEQRVLDIYCNECKTVECALCFIEGHRQHEGFHVSKLVDDFRKQIESNIETLNGCSSKAQMKKEELNKIKEDVQENVERLESDVIKRRDELKQFVDSQANSLLQGICSLSQTKYKEIKMEVDDSDAQISCLRSYSSYCQNMMAKGSPSDICRAFSNLSQKAVELQSQCQSLMERKCQSFKVCFTRSELEEFLEDKNIVGKIEDLGAGSLVAEQKPEDAWFDAREQLISETEKQQRLMDEVLSGYKSDPVLVKTIKGKTKKIAIRGLTILDNELFVVNEKSSEVEVYDSMKFGYSRRFIVENLIRPEDIASCNINKCLYIVDYKGLLKLKEILKVDANGILISNWSTGKLENSFWEGSLSVTGETNVILAVLWEEKLQEYFSDGQLIREINLSLTAGIRHLWHAIKLTNGDFLVCHGYPGDNLHRVCIVDADGNLKNSFGEKRGSAIGQMHNPVHLSVGANGFVMVVDRCNNRVLLLDSDLKFKREILSNEKHGGLYLPAKIHLDELRGRLFVVEALGLFGSDRKISIFDFT